MSQSGETADTFACLKYVKSIGVKTLGIINVERSSIARDVDVLLLTNVGIEKSVATTKAYTAQCSNFYLIAHFMSGKSINIDAFNGLYSAMKTIISNR